MTSGKPITASTLHLMGLIKRYRQMTKRLTTEEFINKARKIQQERYKGTNVTCNARLTPALLKKHCVLDEDASRYLQQSFDKLGMSARAYDRILKVARTVADLEGSEIIKKQHIFSAISFRTLDRKYWME